MPLIVQEAFREIYKSVPKKIEFQVSTSCDHSRKPCLCADH